MSDVPGYLDVYNSENRARWQWRWHLQGGSRFWSARPLQDLRNEEDRRRYREIELMRRYCGAGTTVVSLSVARRKRKASRAKVILDKARKESCL